MADNTEESGTAKLIFGVVLLGIIVAFIVAPVYAFVYSIVGSILLFGVWIVWVALKMVTVGASEANAARNRKKAGR